jgi:glutamate--cysteine ligase
MDLDPFEPVGINAQTIRFLDVFLLHCLLSPSAPDTPQEIAALGRNQQRTAERGREPGLELERNDKAVTLTQWGQELVQAFGPIAQALDAAHGGGEYLAAVKAAEHALHHPDTLPSARVLKAVVEQYDGSFVKFVLAQSSQTHQAMLSVPLTPAQQQHMENLAASSWEEQRAVEAADTMPFDVYLKAYLSPSRLVPAKAFS